MIQFSLDDVLQILKNVGVDPECGACAMIAFTGYGLARHTCKRPGYEPLIITVEKP